MHEHERVILERTWPVRLCTCHHITWGLGTRQTQRRHLGRGLPGRTSWAAANGLPATLHGP